MLNPFQPTAYGGGTPPLGVTAATTAAIGTMRAK